MKNFEDLRRHVLAKPGAQEMYEERLAQFLLVSSLGELRRARELTQVQLAESMDSTQSGVSRMEHQTDLYVRTLRSYIEAMGGELEIVAVFPENSVVIRSFGEIELGEREELPEPDAAENPDKQELLDA